MPDFTKHRREKQDVAVGFADRLDSGDGVSSVNDISITKEHEKADLSSEFGSPTGTVNGDDVELTLSDASAGDQRADTYELLVEVTTSDGDVLVASGSNSNVPTLKVTAGGDPNAP